MTTRPVLDLALLGPSQLRLNGQPWHLKAPPKTLPLLGLLALGGMLGAAREQLALRLWPDLDGAKARANLRRHLHALNAALPAGMALSRQAGLLHLPEGVRVDLWTFLALDTDPEEAVALYRGPLLEGFDEEWLPPERERLSAHFVSLLEELIKQHRAAGRAAPALALAERLLSEDSWREDILRTALRLHAELGDRSTALARLERFQAQLQAELGVQPMPETLALRARLLSGEALDDFPLAGPPTVLAHSNKPMPWQLSLTGREAELDQLRQSWTRAQGGRGHSVWLSGEAGVGKTRLARELALDAEAAGTLVLVGRTTAPETRPHQALVEALSHAGPLLEGLKGEPPLAVLASLLPTLRARRLDLPTPSPLPAEQEQERLAAAVAWALATLTRQRPLLLVLEDLHWASSASLGVLGFLIRRAPQRTLLLLTSRDDQLAGHPLRRVRQQTQEEGHSQVVALGRLSAQEALSAAQSQLPNNEAALVASRSDGLPLFLTELAFEAWRGAGDGIPYSIQETVQRRLERLSEGPRTLVDLASVLGPTFGVALLQTLSGWPEAELLQAVDDLLSARFLRESFGGRLGFVHGLVQESVYAGLGLEHRRRLHRRAGHSLAQERQPERAAEVARHLDQGGEGEAALPHYHQAAQQALDQGAPQEAERFVQRALDLIQRHSASFDQLRFDLLLLREELSRRQAEVGRWEQDLEALEAAAAGDLEAQRTAAWRKIDLLRRKGDYQAELAQIRVLQQLAEPEPRWLARAALCLGRWHYVRGETAQAAQALGPARQIFEALTETAELLSCLRWQALVAIKCGGLEEAEELLREVQRWASADPTQRALISDIGLMLTQANDDDDRQIQFARQHLELQRQLFDRNGEATAQAFLGGSAIHQQRFKDGQIHYQRAGELWTQVGRTQGLIAVQFNLSRLDILTGAVEEGLNGLEQAYALALETNDHMYQADYLIGTAHAHTLLERYPEARALAQQGVRLTQGGAEARLHAQALLYLGVAEQGLSVQRGRPLEAALAAFTAALALLRQTGRPSGIAQALAHLVLLHLAMDDLSQAAHCAEALRALDLRYLRPGMLDLYHLALGQMSARAGHLLEAQTHFIQAHQALMQRVEAIAEPQRRLVVLGFPLSRMVLDALRKRGQAQQSQTFLHPAAVTARRTLD